MQRFIAIQLAIVGDQETSSKGYLRMGSVTLFILRGRAREVQLRVFYKSTLRIVFDNDQGLLLICNLVSEYLKFHMKACAEMSLWFLTLRLMLIKPYAGWLGSNLDL